MAKPVPPRPSLELGKRSPVEFYHPGYPDGVKSRLFYLARADYAGDSIWGVHYQTALVACQIIAGNAFQSGYFALDWAGRQPISEPRHGILTAPKYYFVIDGDDQYPIVPSFRDWQFPHNQIPDFWPDVFDEDRIADRCTLTNVSYAVKSGHLVPREEADWFSRNGMEVYTNPTADINAANNLLPLRSDMHKCFDKRWWTIVPKKFGTGNPQFVSHILMNDGKELWPTQHNIAVNSLPPGSRPFLFARFAWSILLRVKPFLLANTRRQVIRLQIKDEMAGYKNEDASGKQLQADYGGGGSANATPRKKPRSEVVDDWDLMGSGGDSNSEAGDDIWDIEGWRRKRRRQDSSGETAPDDLPGPDNPSLPADVLAQLEAVASDIVTSNLDD